MRYCRKCVQPDTRPGIEFTEDGICQACYYADYPVDWICRKYELLEIIAKAKERATGAYDCVVGVSGGKDSLVQALVARDLGLRVLLVNGAPDCITEVGKENLENLVSKGFDMISLRPNPEVMKKLVRHAFYEYGNPVKPTEYSLYASAWLIAERFNIPLVIQGENPAITLGITKSIQPGGDASAVVEHNTVAEDYSVWTVDGVTLDDLFFYKLPDREKLREMQIVSIYLGYYIKNWSYSNNIVFAINNGLKGRKDENPVCIGRLSPFCSVDSDMQIVNQMLKYYKFGFGFVTDEVGYYIREGCMTREEGIKLIQLFDGQCATNYIQDFCDYINIDLEEFWKVVDKFSNKELFDGRKPKFVVGG